MNNKLLIFLIFSSSIGFLNCKSKLDTRKESKKEVVTKQRFIDLFSDTIEIDGLTSCGFMDFEKNEIPIEYINKYEMRVCDLPDELPYKLKKEEFTIHGIAKKNVNNIHVLLYQIDFINDYGSEMRLLIVRNEEKLANLFFCGNIAADGESLVCSQILLNSSHLEIKRDLMESNVSKQFKNLSDIKYNLKI